MSNSSSTSSIKEASNLYYDDGTNSQGYAAVAGSSNQQSNLISMNSNAANVFNNPNFAKLGAGQSSAQIGNLFNQGVVNGFALNGSYYGLG